MTNDDYYVCPECGDERFSWTVTAVQFGPINAYVDGNDEWMPVHVGDQMGDIVDSEDDPVMCQGCQEEIAVDDLERVEETEGSGLIQ